MQAAIIDITGNVLSVERSWGDKPWSYEVKPHEVCFPSLSILRERKAAGWTQLAIGTFEPVKQGQTKGPLKLVELGL